MDLTLNDEPFNHAAVPAPPSDSGDATLPPAPPPRPRFRPPVGIPQPASDRVRLGFGVSIALHGLILLLIIAPFASEKVRETLIPAGAGGPGPAGGGGGGSGGSGGVPMTERLRYIQVAPAPPAADAITPPVEEKKVEPEPEPERKEPEIRIDTDIPQPSLDVSTRIGIGGGTGSDGSRGTGPGSGGGTGTGQGTGTGSSTGPGTGGGDGDIYSARPKQIFLPPHPRPERVKGTTVVVYFDLDERGRVLNIESTLTRDREYNRRLREALASTEFTPAHKADGTPVPSRYPLVFEL